MSIDSESLSMAAVATKPVLIQKQIKKLTDQVAALSTQVTRGSLSIVTIAAKQVISKVNYHAVSICCQMFSVQ